jgi:hypothetical protein
LTLVEGGGSVIYEPSADAHWTMEWDLERLCEWVTRCSLQSAFTAMPAAWFRVS